VEEQVVAQAQAILVMFQVMKDVLEVLEVLVHREAAVEEAHLLALQTTLQIEELMVQEALADLLDLLEALVLLLQVAVEVALETLVLLEMVQV
jgi:hypothetical protein